MKVFLGGTCNDSKWRDEIIPLLKCDYFNPVVEDWTPECQEEELRQRENSDICLYVLTPEMKGVYSIAEVVDDSNKRERSQTVFVVLYKYGDKKFDESMKRSMEAVTKMVDKNGARIFNSLKETADFLNHVETTSLLNSK